MLLDAAGTIPSSQGPPGASRAPPAKTLALIVAASMVQMSEPGQGAQPGKEEPGG